MKIYTQEEKNNMLVGALLWIADEYGLRESQIEGVMKDCTHAIALDANLNLLRYDDETKI